MAGLRLLVFGAHPDDAEFRCGGLAAMYRDLGGAVKFVSMTNGDAGHHEMPGPELAARRKQEAADAAAVIGAESEVWEHHDGHLQPTLELRWQTIRAIREFQPDLVLTHRPDDYHPDHRAVGNVVRDASYLVTVPSIVPDTPHLRKDPVVGYLADSFTKPTPLQPDVILDVTGKAGIIIRMLAAHESQLMEWLPYNWRLESEVPADPDARLEWVRSFYERRIRPQTERFRERLREIYGDERGIGIEFAEPFEISEYAAPLTDEERKRLFPFVP